MIGQIVSSRVSRWRFIGTATAFPLRLLAKPMACAALPTRNVSSPPPSRHAFDGRG